MRTKKFTVGDLKKALKNLPDNAEVLIPSKGTLWNLTGTEISFFNSKDNKHIKLLSDLASETVVDEKEFEATKERLEAFETATRQLKAI